MNNEKWKPFFLREKKIIINRISYRKTILTLNKNGKFKGN